MHMLAISYFKQHQLYGLSCFEKIPVANQEERGARMKSVGLLAVGYSDLHLHMEFLQRQVRCGHVTCVAVGYVCVCVEGGVEEGTSYELFEGQDNMYVTSVLLYEQLLSEHCTCMCCVVCVSGHCMCVCCAVCMYD